MAESCPAMAKCNLLVITLTQISKWCQAVNNLTFGFGKLLQKVKGLSEVLKFPTSSSFLLEPLVLLD